jgi:DNA-binding NarL/FixJ family response regulator
MEYALTVLLEAVPNVDVLAYAVDIDTLFDLAGQREPDLVILYANRTKNEAVEQVQRIKAAWPATRCLALVEVSRQRPALEAAGADMTELQGVSPKRLLEAIAELAPDSRLGQSQAG